MAIDHLAQEAPQDNGQPPMVAPPMDPRPAPMVPMAAPPVLPAPPSLPVQQAPVYVPVMIQQPAAPVAAPQAPAAPRWQRGRRVAAAAPVPAAAQRRTLETMFPSSAPDRVLVSWQNPENGRLVTIKSYPRADVENFGTLEEFLERVVVPTYRRYGDFHFKWMAADGSERETSASILEPASEEGAKAERASSPIGLLTGLLRDTWERRERGLPVDPQAAQVADQVQRELGGGASAEVLARLARMERQFASPGAGTMSSMEADLMRRLIDQVEQLTREQHQARSTAALPVLPAMDPAQAAREAVRDAIADLRAQQPPPDPLALVDRMMGTFKTMMETLRPAQPQGGASPEADALKAQVEKLTGELERTRRESQEERMKAIEKGLAESAARQEELVRELRQPPEQEKFADRVREVREAAAELTGLSGVARTTPGTAADALRDIVHSVPEILRESQKTIDKLRDRDAAAAERSAEARRAVAEKRAWEARREPATRQQQQRPRESQAAPGGTERPKPEFPVGFGVHMQAFQTAKTDADLVRATLGAFQYLAREVGQPWAPYWDATVSAMRARDREALSYLDAILENFEKSGAVTADVRRRASGACARGFDRIVDKLFPPEAN